MSTARQAEKLRLELGEFVEDRAGPKLEEYARFHDDLAGFIYHYWPGARLYPGLLELCESVEAGGLIAAAGANGVGKTWFMARAMLWNLYARRRMGVVSSTSNRQVKDGPWRELRAAWTTAGLPGQMYEQGLVVDRTQDLVIYAFASDTLSRLQGYHARPGILLWLDEGQGLDDRSIDAALACATGSEDAVVVTGNTLYRSGRFYSILQPSSQWTKVRLPATAHPNIADPGGEQIPGAISPEGIERIRLEWGEDSDTYRSRVLAEFPRHDVRALFRDEWIEAAVKRFEDQPPAEGAPWTIGLDVGVSVDATVLALRQGDTLKAFREIREARTQEIVAAVTDTAAELGGNVTVCCDSTGIGLGVHDLLVEELGRESVVGFVAGSGASDPAKFANARASAAWRLRQRMERGEIGLPDDEQLIEEMRAMTWSLTNEGRILLTPKSELRVTLSRSTDRLDACVMAFAVGRVRRKLLAPGATSKRSDYAGLGGFGHTGGNWRP